MINIVNSKNRLIACLLYMHIFDFFFLHKWISFFMKFRFSFRLNPNTVQPTQFNAGLIQVFYSIQTTWVFFNDMKNWIQPPSAQWVNTT